MDLLRKEQQSTFLSTALLRPVLEPPCVGSFNARLLLSRNPAPRENLVITRSTSRTSNDSIEAYCTKMEQKLQEEITGELQKDAAAEFESESEGTFPPVYINDLVKNAKLECVQCLNRKYMI